MNIQRELKKLADPRRAEGEKKYLKSPMKHYGVTVPSLRRLAKSWIKENSQLSIDGVLNQSQKLWKGKSHEERMIAIFLLVFRVDELSFRHLSIIEKMVRESTGWAQLDMISAWLCGKLYQDDKASMTRVLKRWVKDSNFWVRRASLLTLLGPVRKDKGSFPLFDQLATELLPEKEFFIRKAIGWVLRELSKSEPETVFAYIKKHKTEMSGLTYREATRRLPPAMQRELKNA